MFSALIQKLKRNLPENKHVWKSFTMTALPVIFSSLIFALNSFVDNFMAINQPGGNESLAHANAWTEIQLGIISTTTIVGTALFSQYVGNSNWKKVKEVMNLRMIFALIICLIFAIPCAIFPNYMINIISGFDNGISENVRRQAELYLRIITISWVLNAWAFTLQMIIRERNHGFVSLLGAVLTLAVNIILNSIFIYGFKKGIEFLAYSTIISLSVEIICLMTWVWIKDRNIFINVFKLFSISREVMQQFVKRIPSFLLFAIGSLTINVRFIQWNAGFPIGTIGGKAEYRLSAATILGITGMFFNVFWTTFESLSATVAVYVGKELGQNNIDKAKANAKQLQGFHLVIGFIIGLIALIFSFLIEFMPFLADGYIQELKNHTTDTNIINEARTVFLLNVRNTLLGITVFIPIFVCFVSRDRIISVGGLTNTIATIEALTGLFQTAWLTMIVILFPRLNVSFAWSYFVFFLSDLVKFVVYEIVYHKVNWARNLTNFVPSH